VGKWASGRVVIGIEWVLGCFRDFFVVSFFHAGGGGGGGCVWVFQHVWILKNK
jgi:hypothetical protein